LICTSIEPVTGSEPIIQGGQLNADLACAEDRAESLLHDQAEAPGGLQRVERPRIEVADQSHSVASPAVPDTTKATAMATKK
jgi:hypothetical protein